jgi:hypothetical protein
MFFGFTRVPFVFTRVSFVFTRVPFMFTRVHSCSLVFTCVHSFSDSCGVLDQIDFEGNSLNFVKISRKNWLKETGMENLCASFEGMYYIIV